MIAWLFVAVAAAHPFGQAFYGHAIDLKIAEDHVRVDYVADVPTRELLRDLRARERRGEDTVRFVQDAGLALISGLSLTIDGVAPAIEQLPTEPPVMDERSVTFHLAFSAPLGDGPHRVAIGNANAPEQVAYHRVRADVARAWRVPATSLVNGTAILDNQWRMDETARSAWVDVAPRAGLSAAILRIHPRADEPRLASVAVATSSVDELGETWVPLALMVAGLGGAAAIGWRGSRRSASPTAGAPP